MLVIPVLDLRDGDVVHARRGERGTYAPLRSTLCATHEPVAMAAALLDLFPFPVLYIADLDAILGTGDHREIIQDIARTLPDTELWVDSGSAAHHSRRDDARRAAIHDIIATESCADLATAHTRLAGDAKAVLSLDFRGDVLLGPAALLEDTRLWPDRVIVMTLDCVGSNAGPAVDRIAALHRRAPKHDLHAAGGVRGVEDLERLDQAGAAGALVATCLHDGRLGRAELTRMAESVNARSQGVGP